MQTAEKWYVKNTAGKTFGPIDLETLKNWVRDGRVEPLAGISNDLQSWVIAPSKPELEMNWIVENNPGQFYGPTHRAVVDDLKKSGALSPAARFYCDDHGATAQKLAASEQALAARDTEISRRDVALAEAQKVAARKDLQIEEVKKSLAQRDERLTASTAMIAQRDAQIAELQKTLAARDSELKNAAAAQIEAEANLATLKSTLAQREADIENLKADMNRQHEVHQREWTTEVVVPEVVSAEPPPPVARQAFGSGNANPSALAALEAQAQKELARMGAAGAKRFFGFRK